MKTMNRSFLYSVIKIKYDFILSLYFPVQLIFKLLGKLYVAFILKYL